MNAPRYDASKTLVRAAEDLPSLKGYAAEKKIGEGGMATVFLASDTQAKRKVALKVMLPHLAKNPEFTERFLREAKATLGLKHPHIVELFAYGEDAGRYFMVCEWLDGGTVYDLLAAMRKLPLPLALELFAQLLEALAHAHQRGIVHRDLKPTNLLLSRSGSLKVGDFGIAKMPGGTMLTQTGVLMGTPAYMSPEQAMGRPVDARSDLYASGVVLYELLTGANPRHSDNPTVALAKVLGEELPQVYTLEPGAPAWVQPLLDRLLARAPEDRLASAQEVLAVVRENLAKFRRQYSGLVQACLADPKQMKQRLTHDRANEWFQRARRHAQGGEASKEPAALCAFHAVSLEPLNAEFQRFFTDLCRAHRMNFGASTNPKVTELEKLVNRDSDAPGVLRQLSQLYRLEGNLHRSVLYLRRYLKVRPNDGYAATQLLQMTGEDSVAALGLGPSTQELVAGIRTGGFRAKPQSMSVTGSTTAALAGKSEVSTVQVEDASSALPEVATSIGKKLLIAASILACLGFIVKRVGRMIDSATNEAAQASDTLAHAQQHADNLRLAEQSQSALVQMSQANSKEAARLLDAARAAFNKENYSEAIAGFDNILERYPKRPEAVSAKFLRGKALLASGQPARAIAALSDYLEHHSGTAEYWEALLRRGQAYQAQLEDSLALTDLNQLLEKQPTSPLAIEALMARGEIRARRGSNPDAEADLKAVLERTGPSDPINARAAEGLKKLAAK